MAGWTVRCRIGTLERMMMADVNQIRRPEELSTIVIGDSSRAGLRAPGREGGPAQKQERPTRLVQVGRNSAYVFAQWPLVLVAFIAAVTLVSVGLGLAVVVVGLPILALAAHIARSAAFAERKLIRRFVGAEAQMPVYYRSEGGWLSRSVTVVRDPQSWLDILWCVVGFVVGTVTWSLAVAWWSAAVGGLTWVFYGWLLPNGPDNRDLPEMLGLGSSYLVRLLMYTIGGVVFALTLPPVMRALAWFNAGPALALLSGRAQMQAEVEYQVKGRQAARTAEVGSLRRLERDIHDGPQQRLVRLGMDLGRVRKQVDSDPALARQTLDEAIVQTRQTLEELRALSRGIAPPILADRGLTAALQELTARATLPVHLTIDVPPKLPEHVETAAYFVVSEALTNIAKHAMAEYALVDVTKRGRTLWITVQDNGIGGAQLAKGHGLVGLSDRVRGVDGLLTLSSPPGGPTELKAELPCGS